jgi:ribosomal-protein-alanine N-acetyltransferase
MLTTARLLVRPFTLADVPMIFALSQEDGVRRWIPDQVYADLDEAERVIRALMAFTAQPPAPRERPYVLAVEHEGALIGHVGLSAARGSVEIGYAIAEALQGRGLATETVAAASRWGLDALGLDEVLGIVGADNLPSRRVLEKAGFTHAADDGARIVYVRRA